MLAIWPDGFGVVMFERCMSRWSVFGAVVLLSACGTPRPADAPLIPAPIGAVEPSCVAPASGNLMVGSWYLVRKQAGVAGEIQTLLVLGVDGKMRQTTRVKQGRNIRSELRETGCWEASPTSLVTHVSRSNGELVDFQDPIYTARYVVEKVDTTRLLYREDRAGSKPVMAKKMPAGFQLM